MAHARWSVDLRAALGELRNGVGGDELPAPVINTALLAIIGTLGTLLSCVLVAYGFARFRFPGRNLLFLLLLSTIFLPAAVTLIPTYTIFVKLGLGGYLVTPAGAGLLRERL